MNVALSDLSDGGRVLIWGIRHWMTMTVHGGCVPLSVRRFFETFGEPALDHWLAALVLLAARDADRPLAIHPPCWHELSADEETLVRAVGAATSSPVGARAQLRVLTGSRPTAALVRNVEAVAERFRAVGLGVEVATDDARVDDDLVGRRPHDASAGWRA